MTEPSHNLSRAHDPSLPGGERLAERSDLPAGDFSCWLREMRTALATDEAMDVACGDCSGCCASSHFVQISPHETSTLASIPAEWLVPAPGKPAGHMLLGYDERGHCPLLAEGRCTIHASRPITCRVYDCRVFTAAGMLAASDQAAEINRRVQRWRFGYPTEVDRAEQRAVLTTARFIRDHAASFPGGKVPSDPGQLAMVAIKAYQVFLDDREESSHPPKERTDVEIAQAIVAACRTFDADRRG